MQENKAPIGVFDSGYGGLTVLRALSEHLPEYDYLYLGDNARAPYGTRSFETVYQYTLEAVEWFFRQGCELVILACNTASAKALRTIQQKDLPNMSPLKRVLGVIRPTAEVIGQLTDTQQIGILATPGTVNSESYLLEIHRFFPEVKVYQESCPMWVPIVENGEYNGNGADYFIQKNIQHLLQQGPGIDTILLACTHYPLLIPKIRQYTLPDIKIIDQGEIVAHSLIDYLKRHPEIDEKCAKNGQIAFYTTDSAADFDKNGAIFFGKPIKSRQIQLGH